MAVHFVWTASLAFPKADAAAPSPRSGHSLVYDEERRRVILLDGYQPPYQPAQGEIWSWDGRAWVRLAAEGPSARSLSGSAYDSRRRRIVLYGGVGNKGYEDLRGDTWEWDGERWWPMSDTTVGTRDHHVMAYDAARRNTVLYGGISSGRSSPPETWQWATDTWAWDGQHWSRIATEGPGGRAHFAMVYDSRREQILLFGGRGKDGTRYNDTWVWDGKVWTKAAADGPPPRARHRMAFDSRAGVVVLYGGDGMAAEGGGLFVRDDTWLWDGRGWREVKSPGPGKRMMHAMAYDSARGRVVLYGGGDGENNLGDTWEWDGERWINPVLR